MLLLMCSFFQPRPLVPVMLRRLVCLATQRNICRIYNDWDIYAHIFHTSRAVLKDRNNFDYCSNV